MSDAFSKVIKDNTKGIGNKAFIGFSVVSIAASNNKLKETLKLVKDLALWKFTWPVALLGALKGVQGVMRSLARDTGALDAAITRLGKIRLYQGQLEPLMKSAAAARARLAELMKFEGRSPFNLGDIVAASRALEIYGNGIIKNADGLKLVEQIAKSSGTSMAASAEAVGEFYRQMKEGKPVDQAAEALRDMGVVSEQTIGQLMRMQKGGASWVEVFTAAQSAIRGTTSQSDEFGQSIESLQNQLVEVHEQMASEFGKPFLDAEKRSMEASIKVGHNLAPVFKEVGAGLAEISAAGDGFTNWVKVAASSIPGLATAAGFLTKMLGGVVTALSLVGVVGIGRAAKSAKNLLSPNAIAGGLRGASTFAAKHAGIGAESPSMVEGLFGNAAGMASRSAVAIEKLAFSWKGVGNAALQAGKLMVTSSTGIVAIALVAYAALREWTAQIEEQVSKVQELKNAQAGLEVSLKKEIAAAYTAEEAYAALRKSIDALADAREKLAAMKEDDAEYATTKAHVTKLERDVGVARKKAETLPVGAHFASMNEEAARTLRHRDVVTENRIENATGAEKLDLMQKQKEDLEKRTTEGSGYSEATSDLANKQALIDSEQAQLTKGRNFPGMAPSSLIVGSTGTPDGRAIAVDEGPVSESPEELAVRKKAEKEAAARGSKSELIRSFQDLEDQKSTMKPEDYQKKLAALNVRKDDISKHEEYSDKAKALDLTMKQYTVENKIADIRTTAEGDVAGLKDVGMAKAAKEWGIRKKALADELAAEKQRPQQNLRRQEELSAQIEAGGIAMTEQSRGNTVYQEGAERELDTKKAWREGRGQDAISLSDLSDFASKYEDARSQLGDTPEALDLAKRQANEDIASSAADMARNPVVDSMQRIAGGGGVSADPMMTVAQRQLSLQEKMAGYLQTLSEREDGGGSDEFVSPE